MRLLALVPLLLVACSEETGGVTSTTGSGGATSAQVGTGAGGETGDGGTQAATTTSVTVSTGETSSTGAGGQGGAADGGGGAGGSTTATTSTGGEGGAGGREPGCHDAECQGFACGEDCAGQQACAGRVCTTDPEAPASPIGGPTTITIPPVTAQDAACSSCPGVLWAMRYTLPYDTGGCVTVRAPEGVVYDVLSANQDIVPDACPMNLRECSRVAYGSGQWDQYLVIAVTEPADFSRRVEVDVSDSDLCVGVPEADCSGLGCNGARG